MRTFLQKPQASSQATSTRPSIPFRGQFEPSRAVRPQAHTDELDPEWTRTALPHFRHDFTQLPLQSSTPRALQTKLAVNAPGDQYEREADYISGQVMRRPAPDTAATVSPTAKIASQVVGGRTNRVPRQAEVKTRAVRGGQPLSPEQQAFFEPRFGADFSRVRIHADDTADAASRAVGALAYAQGHDIVFRKDQYRPNTFAGRQLLAHELTHVVQQGAAPSIQSPSAKGSGVHTASGEVATSRSDIPSNMIQRTNGSLWPPGDCSWGKYLMLRGAVESAKRIVSTLGACSAADSCLFLATKIAAITAEISARVTLNATCFRGGDEGHRQQVQEKVNMMNRCYRFFTSSNCSQKLIDAMEAVVERAREVVVAVATAVVAIAAILALIAAIIVLVKAIIAAGAGAAAAGVAAAVLAVLVLIKDLISPEHGPPPETL